MLWPFASKSSVEDENPRIIALLDMDCFECQIYQRNDSKTKGKPCVAANTKGRIVSANYEARKFNISRSIRVPDAKKRCPSLKVLLIPEIYGKPDSTQLRHAGHEVLDTIKEYCNANTENVILEFSPHDEFYLDLTEEVQRKMRIFWYFWYLLSRNLLPLFLILLLLPVRGGWQLVENYKNNHSISPVFCVFTLLYFYMMNDTWNRLKIEVPLDYGKYFMSKLCKEVKKKTKMTASAGVSTNKFRAKLASSENKPDGVFAMIPLDFDTILSNQKIKDVPGLKSTLGDKIYNEFKITTIKQLQNKSKADLMEKLYPDEVEKILNILIGYCDKPVEAKEYSKAINCGKTFPPPNFESIIEELKTFKFKKAMALGVARIWKWIISFFLSIPSRIISTIIRSKKSLKRGGKVENVLRDLSKEMIDRLKEERTRNSREATKLRVELLYFADPLDPNSYKTEGRTFTFNENAGWNGIFKNAINLIKNTTQFNEKKMWVTKVNIMAKNLVEVATD